MQNLTLVGESVEFFPRCSELVNTGNQLDGTNNSTGSLDISEDELAAALQDVAPEETEAMGATLTDASSDQLSSIGSRLQFLCTGSSAFPLASLYQSGSNGGAGEGDFSRHDMFVNAMYLTGDKESVNAANGVENSFDFDASGFTAGIDYRFTDEFIGDLAVSYISSDATFDATFDAGNDTNDTTDQTVSLCSSCCRDNLFLMAPTVSVVTSMTQSEILTTRTTTLQTILDLQLFARSPAQQTVTATVGAYLAATRKSAMSLP